MTPFERARQTAIVFRHKLFNTRSEEGLRSDELISNAISETGEDFDVALVNPKDSALSQADAVLLREFRQILVRNDISSAEQAFLVAHELGHWLLHSADHDSCHRVIKEFLQPESGDSLGVQKIEAYGARERSELQANTFAREFLLPRKTARLLFREGKGARQIERDLNLPLELVRQQLLDGLLLPEVNFDSQVQQLRIIPTTEQASAAASVSRTSLVVAGPGTGKTETLLMRVKFLLASGAKTSELIVLTFSNRAARELVERLHQLGVENTHEIWVGTFHSFGLEFLRKNHEQFGLKPRFGVADKMAQIAVLEPHIYGLDLQKFNPLGDPLDWLNETVKTIQRAKDELADVEIFAKAVLEAAHKTSIDVALKQQDVAKLYRTYETKKRESGNLVDMGDLVMLPALALTKNYSTFEQSVGRFKHILVDEYQDVNRASAQLIKALAMHANSLWVVGDARQAIYRFRGASMRNIVKFGDDFPGYQEFTLNQNRRSSEEIVRVFEHTGSSSHPLQMLLPLDNVHAVRGTSGFKPMHVVCSSKEILESEIASRAKVLAEQGVHYGGQVILASTHETCSATASALNAAGIPTLHLGDIFQRNEIKDCLSLLQLFVDRSCSGLRRVGKLKGLEIAVADLEVIAEWVKTHRPLAMSWLKDLPPELSESGKKSVATWVTVFDGLHSSDSPWEVICTLLLDRTSIIRGHLEGNTILDITTRMALWQFIYFLRIPDGTQAYQTIGSFISRLRRRLRIGDDRELRVPPPEADGINAIAVMTIHQSKGLEFEAVHLVDVDVRHFRVGEDSELLPHALLESISPRNDFEAETEASNKLYVALSRAKKNLIVYEDASKYNSQCAPAVEKADHLFERVSGSSPVLSLFQKPTAIQHVSNVIAQPVDLAGFITYRLCPRRYYYDFVLDLQPSSGLHPAAKIESAVMRELFVPYGEDATAETNELRKVYVELENTFEAAIPYLKKYAEQLLVNGRKWSGASCVPMALPFDIKCSGLSVHVRPYKITGAAKAPVIHFVRIRPSGRFGRQNKIIRWVLKYLNEAYPGYSYSAQIFNLSTGESESVAPYYRLPADFNLAILANDFMRHDYAARPSSWECPRCRHFLHCPA